MSWELLKSKQVFHNRFINVFDEYVISPTGFKTDYGEFISRERLPP